MSRLPSPEGAQQMISLLERVEKLMVEVETARLEVVALAGAKKRYDDAAAKLEGATRELGKLLESMDCSSLGNAGWEGRIGWLMLEMRRVLLSKACVEQRLEQLERMRDERASDCSEGNRG